jgi:hypothetical protein
MKKQITRALLGFAMLFVLAAAAPAQTTRHISVRIPFNFVAGRKQLPAGDYTIRRVGDSASALLIRSEDGRGEAIVITSAGDASPEGARVVFRQHGERFFLASVSVPGAASVREVPESHAEKKFVRESGGQAKAGEAAGKTVTVAGNIQ